MTQAPESFFPADYRGARRAFIGACEAAKVDTIARVHPGKGSDGRPLFTDSAALGDRLAPRATLVLSNGPKGGQAQIALLKQPPPPGARLVLVHALDPAHFGGPAAPDWARTVLMAVATEDLSRVVTLTAMDLTGSDLLPILKGAMLRADITLTAPATE